MIHLTRIISPKSFLLLALSALMLLPALPAAAQESAARTWNEELLFAIRRDRARPTVHARNLFHLSIAMWDSWAVYSPTAPNYLFTEKHIATDKSLARAETLSFAAYRILRARFTGSPGQVASFAEFDAKMLELGYDISITSTAGDTPAEIGNRIAAAVIAFGLADGSNEAGGYATPSYVPVNEPLVVGLPGTVMVDPNRWQPLAIDFFVDQSGIILGPYPPNLTPHWGGVTPFGLTEADRSPNTHFDPGPPPMLGGVGSDIYIANALHNIELCSHLDPDDGVTIDISPAVSGNRPLGSYNGTGYALNPVTGQPYPPNVVKRGDWARVLAEFWADGPNSETPPGHWNTVANYVTDQPNFERRIGGSGPLLDALEYDVKMYLVLNGGLHDAAICAWGAKGFYDTNRPISAIRYMASLGQSSEPAAGDYDPLGIPLVPGLVERIDAASSAVGERHEHLAAFIGEFAVRSWPGAPVDQINTYSGVVWMRALLWIPYQQPTFVTPPFAGYVSGHSTYSRTAAEVLTLLTGSPYFPNGLGEFFAPQNQYLKFEDGPSEDIYLQWASYYDAADESGLSRIYGGIHPRHDDIPGRIIGNQVGQRAWSHAQAYYTTTEGVTDPFHNADQNGDNVIGLSELLRVIQMYNINSFCCQTGTEDGFAPGNGVDFNCTPHSCDYNPQDWTISFSELLRIIQLYNSLTYHICSTTGEDGFCPGV